MHTFGRKIGLTVAALGLALALVLGVAAFNANTASAQTKTPAAQGAKAGKIAKQRGGRHIVASVTAVSGQQLSLAWRGWTQTVTVGSDVKITSGDKTIALADIKVGDQVVFGYKKGTDGKPALNTIRVVLPRAGGTVTAVNGSSFTLSRTDKAGKTTTTAVTTDSTTVFTKGRKESAALTDVTVNSRVVVVGTRTSDGGILATHVHIGKAKK